jgi:hypothetical protein
VERHLLPDGTGHGGRHQLHAMQTPRFAVSTRVSGNNNQLFDAQFK